MNLVIVKFLFVKSFFNLCHGVVHYLQTAVFSFCQILGNKLRQSVIVDLNVTAHQPKHRRKWGYHDDYNSENDTADRFPAFRVGECRHRYLFECCTYSRHTIDRLPFRTEWI